MNGQLNLWISSIRVARVKACLCGIRKRQKKDNRKKGVGVEGENHFPSTVRKQDRVSVECVCVCWERERDIGVGG